MGGGEPTRDRLLRAFLTLAADRGMAAVTTREIAVAAGVNEVTLFRHFGDKATLAREAVRRFHPAEVLDSHLPAIDTSAPEPCLRDLVGCLRLLDDHLNRHPELLQFGLAEAVRYPDLLDDLKATPYAGRRLLTRAFEQARTLLRPSVDIEAEVLGFLGMLLLLAIWRSRGWWDDTDREVDDLLAARLRPLLKSAVNRSAGDAVDDSRHAG